MPHRRKYLQYAGKTCIIPGMARKTPIEKAAARVGSKSALARLLKVAVQSIQQWDRIPAERVHDVERVTGIPRHELRPDLYPKAREAA